MVDTAKLAALDVPGQSEEQRTTKLLKVCVLDTWALASE